MFIASIHLHERPCFVRSVLVGCIVQTACVFVFMSTRPLLLRACRLNVAPLTRRFTLCLPYFLHFIYLFIISGDDGKGRVYVCNAVIRERID